MLLNHHLEQIELYLHFYVTVMTKKKFLKATQELYYTCIQLLHHIKLLYFHYLKNYLKKQKKSVHIVAVEPATSPVLSQGKVGPHKIQGIGAGFIPDTLDTSVYDEIISIKNDDAFEEGRAFARSEGILVGISAGAALKAAVELAKRKENKGADKSCKCVIIMTDFAGKICKKLRRKIW